MSHYLHVLLGVALFAVSGLMLWFAWAVGSEPVEQETPWNARDTAKLLTVFFWVALAAGGIAAGLVVFGA